MPELTVDEAAATYESAMRHVPPAERGAICAICRTFIGGDYDVCLSCSRQPSLLDVVVPITYSEHLGQVHDALRGYKDGLPQVQNYAMPRLAAILWKFVERHEHCVAAAAGVGVFDIVTSVPSSTAANDERRANLRTIVGWCRPLAGRFQRVLAATDLVSGRAFDSNRYRATTTLSGATVLLIDDTWTTGGHAQSACDALRAAGATTVGLIVIGRHVRRDWQVVAGGPTSGELLDALPKVFDWTTCTSWRVQSRAAVARQWAPVRSGAQTRRRRRELEHEQCRRPHRAFVNTPSRRRPRGRFYVRNRLSGRALGKIYGPLAFGTSAHSAVLTDWPGGGVIGIHGTNQPELLPGRVSHGCIRLRNADVRRLGRRLKLGTPIAIR